MVWGRHSEPVCRPLLLSAKCVYATVFAGSQQPVRAPKEHSCDALRKEDAVAFPLSKMESSRFGFEGRCWIHVPEPRRQRVGKFRRLGVRNADSPPCRRFALLLESRETRLCSEAAWTNLEGSHLSQTIASHPALRASATLPAVPLSRFVTLVFFCEPKVIRRVYSSSTRPVSTPAK